MGEDDGGLLKIGSTLGRALGFGDVLEELFGRSLLGLELGSGLPLGDALGND